MRKWMLCLFPGTSFQWERVRWCILLNIIVKKITWDLSLQDSRVFFPRTSVSWHTSLANPNMIFSDCINSTILRKKNTVTIAFCCPFQWKTKSVNFKISNTSCLPISLSCQLSQRLEYLSYNPERRRWICLSWNIFIGRAEGFSLLNSTCRPYRKPLYFTSAWHVD